MEDQNKLQNLEKALGTNNFDFGTKPNLGLDPNALDSKSPKLNLGNAKNFGAQDSKLSRSAFDHKGKNKEVLKGNAKAKR
jgi:hypothetical protein